MTFTEITAPQRSPEWFAARLGRLTGSRADCVTAQGRNGAEAVKRRDYRLELACERLTGVSAENGFTSAEMQRGTDLEPAAVAAYEAATGELITASGFLSCTDVLMGCSLDGHVGDFDGIVEIKCPKTATHVGYLEAGILPPAYVPQVTHNMLVSGAQWCDFVSYDDRLPESLRLFIVRVTREELDLTGYELASRLFLGEVDHEVHRLLAIAEKRRVA